MEGIVRQVRRDAPKADMVFVYTIREDSVAQYDLTNATFPRSIAASEVVADHYGIPTIHLGMEIIKLANLGRVKWRQGAWASKEEVTDTGDEFWFGSDGVHPHAWTGCKEYTMAIERCLPRIDGRSLGPGPTTLSSIKAQYPLPEPLDPRNYENATWVSPDRARLAPGIAKLRSTVIFPLRDLGDAYRAQHPGDTFTLDFWGSYVGIYSLVGPFSGTLLLTLDGGTPRPYSLFSTFNHYNRPAYFPLFSGLSVGPHTLVLDVSPDIPDKVSIMASKNRTIPAEAQVRTDCVVLAFCVL